MVPIAVGVVAVLAAGGAWVALSGGEKNNAVSPDTVAIRSDTQNTDSSRRGTGTPGGRTRQTPANPNTGTQTTTRLNPTGIDPARAGDSLNALLDNIDDLSGPALRDAALGIYNTPGVSTKDSAMAAYLTANGFAKLDDRATTCDWARRAARLEPSSQAYNALKSSTCGS